MGRNRLLLAYNPEGSTTKGPHKLVAPHELSSEFLFRMRRRDRASALAVVDQSKVLRHVFQTLREDVLGSRCVSDSQSCVVGTDSRPRVQTRAGASRYSSSGSIDNVEPIKQSSSGYSRTNIHVRCANKERHAVFEACSWSGALLAT